MPADDEFPRGWWQGVQAITNTIPAIPGVAHVLTSVNIYLVTTGALGGFYAANVQTTPIALLGFMGLPAATPAGTLAAFNWTGKAACSINTALVVALTVALPANVAAIIEIEGYDI